MTDRSGTDRTCCLYSPPPVRRGRVTAFLLLIVLVGGCADTQTYRDPTLPAQRVARLESSRIEAIDGRSLDSVECDSWRNWLGLAGGSVALLPGHHDLDVRVTWEAPPLETGYTETRGVSFDAEAGHTYALRQKQLPPGPPPGTWPQIVFGTPVGLWSFDAALPVPPLPPPSYRMYVWVEDVTSRTIVGGNPPP